MADESFRQYVAQSIDSYRHERDLPINKLVRWLDNKRYSQSFARKLGVRVPEHLGRWTDIGLVPWAEMPNQFVLKPQWGSSNNGVFLLERKGEGVWYDSMRSKTFLQSEIIDEYHSECERFNSIIEAVMAEERFVQQRREVQVPLDYKMYAFHGRVELIMQRNVNGSRTPKDWKYMYFDRNWETIEPPLPIINYEEKPILPSHTEELVTVAEVISKSIPRPFIRIDLYDAEGGVGFGELTSHPGTYKSYFPEWDKKLGEAWGRALAEIGDGNQAAEELLQGPLFEL